MDEITQEGEAFTALEAKYSKAKRAAHRVRQNAAETITTAVKRY